MFACCSCDYDYDVVFCKGRCVGTNKPCDRAWDLDADGYCKFHSPNARQCTDIAAKTGARCRIKWDLNANQLCKYHAFQTSQASVGGNVTKSGKSTSAKGDVAACALSQRPSSRQQGSLCSASSNDAHGLVDCDPDADQLCEDDAEPELEADSDERTDDETEDAAEDSEDGKQSQPTEAQSSRIELCGWRPRRSDHDRRSLSSAVGTP